MASIGFRWLDILEKEFDKAFVDLDLAIGVLDLEEPDVVYNVRQKLCTLSSCFAQLTHKAQAIFQNSAKIEAELIHMRAELVESKAKKDILEQELHNILLQLHSSQLAHLPGQLAKNKQDSKIEPDVNNIKKRLEDELKKTSTPSSVIASKNSSRENDELKFSSALLEAGRLREENAQLQVENSALRNSMLALNSEVYGAKLAAKYLDKELAGRIQQLQLLGREMRRDTRHKLWRQLESEILLQRHKTVVRACRRNSLLGGGERACPKPDVVVVNEAAQSFGDIRTVVVKREQGQGLGISITGGREHGVPILISDLELNGPAALSGQLYIGDAILFVNEHDLRQACHSEAVEILKQQTGDCQLQVQYIAADDSDNSLEEDGFNFRYKFFDTEVCSNDDLIRFHPPNSALILNTPTAPRTPESSSQSRPPSRGTEPSAEFSPKNHNNIIVVSEPTSDITNQKYNTPNHNQTYTDALNNFNDTSDEIQTTDLILIDNRTDNIIKLENFKKSNDISNIEDNLNCSSISLNSENLSSPMQTSTDVFLDSEILSTDVASNDSQSPKNVQTSDKQEMKNFKEFNFNYGKPSTYICSDNVSNPKSDQSLLNSDESCDSSPVHKINRDYKKKHKPKKYFGVKTLQSIFSKHDGYSDISTTASEIGEDLDKDAKIESQKLAEANAEEMVDNVVAFCKSSSTETTPQFEENIHNLLSEMFVKNFQPPESVSRPIGTKKYFSLHGQNLRVGKALRLCPNEELTDNEQKKEKLLARYVYNANSCNVDGVGDPDFGTPV